MRRAAPGARLPGRARGRRRAGRADGPGDLRLEDRGDSGRPRLDRQDRPPRDPAVRRLGASGHGLHRPAALDRHARHHRTLRVLPRVRGRVPGRRGARRRVARGTPAPRPLRLRRLRRPPIDASPSTTRSAASASGSAPGRGAPSATRRARRGSTARRRRETPHEVPRQSGAGDRREQRHRPRHGAPARERGRVGHDLRPGCRATDGRPATARGTRRHGGRRCAAT